MDDAEFLAERRKRMAHIIREGFKRLAGARVGATPTHTRAARALARLCGQVASSRLECFTAGACKGARFDDRSARRATDRLKEAQEATEGELKRLEQAILDKAFRGEL